MTVMEITIGQKKIGRCSAPFIIAEAGINHNGQLETALEMIRVAREAGVDCIKFQTFKAEEFVGDPEQTYTYKSRGREVTESMLEMFKRYELSRDEWFRIKKRCDELGIIFLSTPQNFSDLELLLEIGIDAIKVGSDDFTNIPLLKSYAGTGLPLMVSCGMADMAEVYQALEVIGSLDGYPTVLMLCTSQYPTPPEDLNLLKLKTLQQAFPMVTLGFSDHSQGCLASFLAVALGAVVFEKHFTLDRNLPGPDHWFSEDPESLKKWVDSIKMAGTMLGNSVVRPTDSEQAMKMLARRSIVALSAIDENERITKENIGLKRPGGGLPAGLFEKILGLKSTRKIPQGHILRWGDFA
ncbi:MAG: N-acetylneuraminate synthase family protein [Chitinophagaceae bacterium]|nr:N-acetylneuraminate synthase family protein [Chitinophagaceae bacterium]